MGRYIIRRLLAMVPLLLAISILSFAVMHFAPGDPVMSMTDRRGVDDLSSEELTQLRHQMGLDQPVYVQYARWLGNVVQGNFGYSLISRRPVGQMIAERLPNTLALSVIALVITLILALPLGVLCARFQNSLFDQGIAVLTFIGFSLPNFWLALMAIYIFAVGLHWLPAGGMMPLENVPQDPIGRFLAEARHYVLPVATMVILDVGGWLRYQRSSMLEALHGDYVRTARAKGLREKAVFFRHAWRNALLPVVTWLGVSLSALVNGSFMIETIFAWPGMGRLGLQAIFQRDYPLIMAVNMLSSILIVIGNLLADVTYALVDPRIRYD
jgi:peptide/nickel transport system permease protein